MELALYAVELEIVGLKKTARVLMAVHEDSELKTEGWGEIDEIAHAMRSLAYQGAEVQAVGVSYKLNASRCTSSDCWVNEGYLSNPPQKTSSWVKTRVGGIPLAWNSEEPPPAKEVEEDPSYLYLN